MSRLVWDKTGDRLYETGVKQCVLYPQVAGAYPKGVAWNGITSVTESPSGTLTSCLQRNSEHQLKPICIRKSLRLVMDRLRSLLA